MVYEGYRQQFSYFSIRLIELRLNHVIFGAYVVVLR